MVSELPEELKSALDELGKFQVFDVMNLQVRMKIETVYIPDFSVVVPAFANNGSLGNLTQGDEFTLMPQESGGLQYALRNLRHAMGGLEEPSYTMHTFQARVDHILDVARTLFATQEYIKITKLEELQWLVYPYSRREANGQFEKATFSVLGDMREFVMDMEGASKIEATGMFE